MEFSEPGSDSVTGSEVIVQPSDPVQGKVTLVVEKRESHTSSSGETKSKSKSDSKASDTGKSLNETVTFETIEAVAYPGVLLDEVFKL